MEDILQALIDAKFSVDLKHDNKESRNGYVTVYDSQGIEVVHSSGLQNVTRKRSEAIAEFVDEVIQIFSKREF
jgi:signal transduction histidine kinase